MTEEEVKILIEQEMVERVFRLSDRSVNSLMTHRSEMVWLDVEDPLEENIKKILTPGQTNFVVCQGELDHVIGVLDARDLLRDYADTGSISIPESLPIIALCRKE